MPTAPQREIAIAGRKTFSDSSEFIGNQEVLILSSFPWVPGQSCSAPFQLQPSADVVRSLWTQKSETEDNCTFNLQYERKYRRLEDNWDNKKIKVNT